MKRIVAIFLILAGPAPAQELSFSMAATEACLAGTANVNQQRTCIGLSAQACMATPIGGTTIGMSGCYDREWKYWDARLNAAYQHEMVKAKEIDAEMDAIGATVPSQSDALREMQRAWIPYRDAKCDFEYSHWGGGTGGGPAITACMMQETGEQALYIETSGFGE